LPRGGGNVVEAQHYRMRRDDGVLEPKPWALGLDRLALGDVEAGTMSCGSGDTFSAYG
jgi:hypothetical protein